MNKNLLIEPTYDNSIEVFVEGDVNDGDYISRTSFMTEEEFDLLLPVYKEILKTNDFENFVLDDFLENIGYTLNEINEIHDTFVMSLPYLDNEMLHTISEVSAYYLSKEDSIRYIINF